MRSDKLGMGIAIGAGIGVAIGVATHQLATWIGIGVALGAGWGSYLARKQKPAA